MEMEMDRLRRGGRVRLEALETLEAVWVRWLARHSITLLRISLGLVFLGFGVLKFFPGHSPAEALAARTFGVLTFGVLPADLDRVLVAALETAVGLCLTTGWFLRPGVRLLGVNMVGVLSPLVLFPHELFPHGLTAPTLEAQYVVKDAVLLCASMVVAARALGGRLVVEATVPIPAQSTKSTRLPTPLRSRRVLLTLSLALMILLTAGFTGSGARTSHTRAAAPAPTTTAPGTIVIHNFPRTAVVGQAEFFSVLLAGQPPTWLTYFLHYPDGHEEHIPMRTDGHGYSSYTFLVSPYQARRFRETGTVGVADASGRVLASTHLAIQQH
jgi:uncharacterized membrane protein YphA (DoxX/SURF4 family)